MRKIYITEKQLDELINKDGMLSTDTTPEYEGSKVSVTEPVDGLGNYGKPTTADEKQRSMAPGLFQRMLSTNLYGGPTV